MSIKVTIVCDVCGVYGDVFDPARDTKRPNGAASRARLYREGWRQSGTMDVCPECLATKTADGKARQR